MFCCVWMNVVVVVLGVARGRHCPWNSVGSTSSDQGVVFSLVIALKFRTIGYMEDRIKICNQISMKQMNQMNDTQTTGQKEARRLGSKTERCSRYYRSLERRLGKEQNLYAV